MIQIKKMKWWLIGIGVVIVLVSYFLSQSAMTADSQIVSSQSLAKSKSHTSNRKKSVNRRSNLVTCDISGAVQHEGVYTLKSGMRLNDLIIAAGGTTKRAQLKSVNRAVLLKDQAKFYIPYLGEKVAAIPSSEGTEISSASSENDEKVHLNQASSNDLQKLNGIGVKKAEQIIQYRQQNGPFKSIEDLTNVTGIGEKTFAALKDQLAL